MRTAACRRLLPALPALTRPRSPAPLPATPPLLAAPPPGAAPRLRAPPRWPVPGPGQWAVPGVPRPAQPAGPAPLIAQLGGVLDALHGHGPVSGTAVDTLALLRLAEQARGLALRELAELDATGTVLPGVRATPASWLRDTQLLGNDTARATVRLARRLRDTLPQIGQLLCAGGTTHEHAAAVAHGVHGLDQQILADTDAAGAFTAQARTADPGTVRRQLRDKAHALDDRLGADTDRRARDRQGLRLKQVGGHTAIDGTLAGEDGALVRLALGLAADTARTHGDTRSTAARHAQVLTSWATGYLHRAHGPGDSLDGDAHTVRTHLLISCTPSQLTAHTAAHRPHRPHRPHRRDRHAPTRPARPAGPARPTGPAGPARPAGPAGPARPDRAARPHPGRRTPAQRQHPRR